MPAIRRTGTRLRRELTFEERQRLLLGFARGNPLPTLADVKAAWEQHGPDLMETYRQADRKRPWAWWLLDCPEPAAGHPRTLDRRPIDCPADCGCEQREYEQLRRLGELRP